MGYWGFLCYTIYMALRFEVPQFIDVKDKIFGPFTLQQFLFMAGGGGLAYVAYRGIPSFLKYPIVIGLVALGIALAFYQVNGRPFSYILQALLTYLVSAKNFVWRQRRVSSRSLETKKKDSLANVITSPTVTEGRLSDRRISDISWNLDILDSQSNEKKVQ